MLFSGNRDKKRLWWTGLVLLLVLLTSSTYCIGSDTKREQYYAHELSKTVDEDELVWLAVNRQPFLALYREAETTETKGAIILLHDLGMHPDHQPMLHSLRTELPCHQWSTLSIQMPIREQGAKVSDYELLLPEATQRINSAVNFFEKKKITPLAILGVGLGGVMASYFVAQSKPNQIQALVVAFLIKADKKNIFPAVYPYFQKIDIPVLDIVCCEKKLSRTSKNRKKAIKKNQQFQQLHLMQSKPNLQESQRLLKQRINGWLNRVLKENKY